jgi:ribosomal protein S18 acetylase RimI-like enzyme
VVTIREFCDADAAVLWTLSVLPNIGFTADPTMPLALPAADAAPSGFPDLADVHAAFTHVGGLFLVAEHDGHLVGMGGFRPNPNGQAEVLRVRTHPAMRRRGIGRSLMTELETRAREQGLAEMFLDTATNQPEAVSFYQSLGYHEVGRETHPEWSWTLVYFIKPLR